MNVNCATTPDNEAQWSWNHLQNIMQVGEGGSVWREPTVMRISSIRPNSQAYALCDITQVMTVIKTFSFAGAAWDIPGPILQFTSHGCSWRCAAWWEDCICLPNDPPLSWTHQANWSAMWGRGITARRAPLYGSSSFYTFCCITVQGNWHTHIHTHRGCPNNKLFTSWP